MINNYKITEFKNLLEKRFGKVNESREYKLISGKSRKILDVAFLDKNKNIVGILEHKRNGSFVGGKIQLQNYANEVLEDKGYGGLLLDDKLFVFEKNGFDFEEVNSEADISEIFWKGANLLRGRYKTTESIKIILSLFALNKHNPLDFKELIDSNDVYRIKDLFDNFKHILDIDKFIDFESIDKFELKELLHFVLSVDLSKIKYKNIIDLFKHDRYFTELFVPQQIQDNLFKGVNNQESILFDFMQNKTFENTTYTSINYDSVNFRKLINYICDNEQEKVLMGDYILLNDVNKYDLIVSCPPFNLRKENLEYEHVEDNEFSGIKSKEHIVYYLGKLLHQLKEGGTLKIVLPNGFYFRSGVLSTIRKHLKHKYQILSIETYNEGIFNPLTNIPVSVLTLKKEEPNNESRITFRRYNVEKQRREVLGVSLDKEFTIKQFELEDIWTFDLYLQKSFSEGDLPLSNKKYPMVTLKEILTENKVGRQIETSTEGSGFYLKGESIKKNYINYKDAGRIDVNDNLISKSMIKKGDILFSRIGINHKFAVNSIDNVCVNQNVMILTPDNNKVLPEFLALLLNLYNDEGLLKPLHAGTAIMVLNTKSFMDLKIYLPSIKEQKTIVDKLKKYSKMLEDKKDLIIEFSNLFYKLENEPKDNISVTNVCELINPKRLSSKEFVKEGKYPVISSKHFKEGVVEGFDDMTNVDINLYEQKENIVLINTFLDSLNAAIVQNNKNYVIGNWLYGLKPTEKLNQYYLLALLLSGQLNDELEQTLTGTHRPSINFTKLKEVKIPVLSMDKQKEFEKIFIKYLEEKSKLNSFWTEIENEVRSFYE